jgi:hypothetical protein
VAVGPREWSPKMEPAKKDFKFAGLKIHVERLDRPLVEFDEDRYDTTVTAPDKVTYRYMGWLSSMDKYQGTGLLGAAMAALLDIELVKTDLLGYRVMLETVHGVSPDKANRISIIARVNSQSFSEAMVREALDQITAEMNKLPSVQRQLDKGWDDLMKRRGQPPA